MKNSNNYYSTTERIKQSRIRFAVALIVLGILIAAAGYLIGTYIIDAGAEDSFVTCYVMCKPVEGNYVSVRRTPSKSAQEVGRLECGDWFETDAVDADGWLRVFGVGEYGEGWIYCGFVSTEEPEMIMKNCRVKSNGRVIIRRWMNGPKVDGKGYLVNGSTVTVFCVADGWACTSRGYVRAEYLEADPE